MSNDHTSQAVWNLDEGQTKAIYALKIEAISCFRERDLEGVYWTIRGLWREIDAKLKPKKEKDKDKSEQEEMQDGIHKLEQVRGDHLNSENQLVSAGDYFIKLETYYIELCRLMKKHGLYYREGDDPSRVFRR